MVRKIFLSLGVLSLFGFYVLYQRGGETHALQQPASLSNANSLGSTSAGTNPPTSSSNISSSGSTPPPTTKQSGSYVDGTYTGPSVDVYYGNVQVKVKISGGRITDVSFLNYPQDRSTSQEINSQATPWLSQEAIQAQSANVDIVSGATLTSQGFQQSLSQALAQAVKA